LLVFFAGGCGFAWPAACRIFGVAWSVHLRSA
jgi:hypothetical protein